MKPSKEIIEAAIAKYREKVSILKMELEQLKGMEKKNYIDYLIEYEMAILMKGARNRKREIENELRNIYTKIGKLSINV